MKNHLMPFIDKVLLRKRFIIETIFGVMKTDFNLEHSRHRSPINAFVNILACLIPFSIFKYRNGMQTGKRERLFAAPSGSVNKYL